MLTVLKGRSSTFTHEAEEEVINRTSRDHRTVGTFFVPLSSRFLKYLVLSAGNCLSFLSKSFHTYKC